MLERKLLKNIDYLFIAAIAAVMVMSFIVLSSAGASITNDPLFYAKKQILWAGIGIMALLLVLSINYGQLQRYSRYLYAANLIMLLAVLLVGEESKGAQRWIELGPFVLQPSEFAKIIMIITFANFLAVRQGKLNRLRDLVPCFLFVGVPMLLILKQPDLGTSLVFIGIMLGMLLVGGANPWLLGGLVLGGLAVGVGTLWAHFQLGLSLPLEDYQITRLVVFLDPYNDGFGGRGAGYHMIQSLVAIGSGGILGKGLRQGSQVQFNFLPEHHTDFIFSVVGEELGLLGALLLLLFYFIIIYRSLHIALIAKDIFGVLLVTGVISMFAFHILVNVGMTVGIMPITGLPLPLFSYGGSSMLANMLALGLILNVNLRRQKIMF